MLYPSGYALSLYLHVCHSLSLFLRVLCVRHISQPVVITEQYCQRYKSVHRDKERRGGSQAAGD